MSERSHPFLSIPWRRLGLWLVALLACAGLYALWQPGAQVTDGRHDRGRNGMWLQHGWIGDDAWYARYNKEALKARLRGPAAARALAARLRARHIRDVFPHLAPSSPAGNLLQPDHAQLEVFLDALDQQRVMPWIGGVYHRDVRADSARWRARFIADAVALLKRHPRLAGVHLNIEPWPSGDPHLLVLLDELRAALPAGKVLSVAAYPPPVPVIGNLKVHWTPAYIRQVARRVDHMAFMCYDSGLKVKKPYVALMARWTVKILDATRGTETLLGLPAYDDHGAPWHSPDVENLETGMAGVHQGLLTLGATPEHYQGVALYADWEMSEAEWSSFARGFLSSGEGAR